MKYHWFIPAGNKIVHWTDTLKNFQDMVRHKRQFESHWCFSEDANVYCRVLNPKTMTSADMYMSEIMEAKEDDLPGWYYG